jgi:ABC-type glycerol-3-phosphate transport system substrate-binding protein
LWTNSRIAADKKADFIDSLSMAVVSGEALFDAFEVSMKRLAILLLVMLWPSEIWSQPRKPATLAEIATYNGPDREQLLYAGAKVEGKIVWYTSLAGDSYKAIARGFEAKYPGYVWKLTEPAAANSCRA